jgi:DNA-binding LacI/PurR family transcriptional regulator
MWRLGHRKIALLSVAEENEPTLDRRAGYLAAARKHRRPPVLIVEDDPAVALRATVGQQVTALLVESTAMADGVKAFAASQGITVPDDLSLVVLGDSDPTQQPSAHSVPQSNTDWSMFRIPRREMGVQAVRMLIELVGGGSPKPLVLPCEIHEGSTVAAV